jgi:hypothetical protein
LIAQIFVMLFALSVLLNTRPAQNKSLSAGTQAAAPKAAKTKSTAKKSALIDINSASKEELAALPKLVTQLPKGLLKGVPIAPRGTFSAGESSLNRRTKRLKIRLSPTKRRSSLQHQSLCYRYRQRRRANNQRTIQASSLFQSKNEPGEEPGRVVEEAPFRFRF